MAVWPLVRTRLDKLHKELRRAAKKTLEMAEKEGLSQALER